MNRRYKLVNEPRRLPSGQYIIYETKKRWFGGEKWVPLSLNPIYFRTEEEARDHIKYLLTLEVNRAKPDQTIGYFE